MDNPKRIRSNYQRRILSWLSDGGGSVSDVSKALGIRMPHASAALKQLRESGYVVRDEENIRGSVYRLSADGLARIESDDLYRLLDCVNWPPPPGAAGIVLSRDGPMLLLGYASTLSGPLLGLPDRPMETKTDGVNISNGKEGAGKNWRWAVQRGDGTKWWDIENKRQTEPPTEPSSLTLSAWMERPKVMGIVKARLLDEDLPWPLSVGSWFEQLPDGYWPELPKVLTEGELTIGRAGNSGPKVNPRGAIHARIGRRGDKSLIFSSLPNKTIKIVESSLLEKKSTALPKGILKHWMKIIHPRLNDKSLETRYKKLAKELGKVSNSLTRKVLNDFPGRDWTNSDVEFLDTTSVTSRGAEAIVSYALENYQNSLALDWRWSNQSEALERFSNDSRGKIIVSNLVELELPFLLSSTGQDGKYDLRLRNRLHIPITIGSKTSVPSNWQPPTNPEQLIRGTNQTANDAGNETEAMWQAVNLAVGDDEWADRHESEYPLAAWIASTKESQPSRWRRVGHKIDPNWATLADYNQFDDRTICDLALFQNAAMNELLNRIRSNPLVLNKLNFDNGAVAAAILLSEEWIDDEYDVIDTWLKNPIKINEVLKKNWQSDSIERLCAASTYHQIVKNNENVSREEILAVMEEVDFNLWKQNAKLWLMTSLSSSIGRTAISDLDLPWPVILVDAEISSEDLNLVYHMPDGIGKESLMDVIDGLEAVENGKPPPIGRTHPYAGWLFQERIPSLPLECDSNLEIHIELHRRVQNR